MLTALLLMAVASVSAQLRPKISLSAGGNISTVRWYNTFDLDGVDLLWNEGYEASLGFQVSCSFELPVSSTLGALISPTFSRRGYGYKDNFLGQDSRIRFDYLDLPILVRFYPKGRFYAETGVAVSFLLDTDTFVEGEPVSQNIIGGLYEDTDFSILLGLGYSFSDRFSINLRALHGLMTTIDAEFSDENGDPMVFEGARPKLLNQSLQLSVQYAILNP